MIRIAAIVSILLAGCNTASKLEVTDTNITRTTEYQEEINELLSLDREHKLLEEEYLREIAIAQDNNDEEAYKFFFREYIQVPRIPLEDWLKNEPNFYPRRSAQDVVKEYREQN